MRPHDRVLELLRAANPAPELDRLDPDHLERISSLLEERRVPMNKNLRQSAESVPARPNRRPLLAFGLGLILVLVSIGAGTWLLAGNDTTAVVTSPPTAPASNTESAPIQPEAAQPAPGTTLSTITPTTTTLPMKTMAEGVITLTGDSHGVMVSAAIDSQGRLMAAYWAENDETLKVVRCIDTGCALLPETFTLASIPSATIEGAQQPPGLIDMVLQANGAPIVIAGNPGRDFPTVYACIDADCATVESAYFTAEGRVDRPHIALAPDGTPRITYSQFSNNVITIELAVCGDLVCSADERTTITIDTAQVLADHSTRIDQDGRILVGYENVFRLDELAEARVAVCADDTCSDGPTILTFDNAIGARTTVGTDGDFWVWYRSGPPDYRGEGDFDETTVQDRWDLMVVSCNETRCSDAAEVEVGWGLLMAWPIDVRLTALSDGTVAAGFNYWSSALCAAPLELTVLDPTAAQMGAQLGVLYPWGFPIATVGTGVGVVVVFGAEERGLQAVELGVGGPVGSAGLDRACDE